MPTKGGIIRRKETRGKSPSLPQKVEIGQPNLPSILERIKSLTSTESGKVPIYCKHTVCSILYVRDPIVKPSFDKAEPPRRSLDKLVPRSKVVSTKSKSNDKNVTSLYMKTSSTKPNEVGKRHPPLKSKNFVNTMEKHVNGKTQTRQPTEGLEYKTMIVEKKPGFSDAYTSSNDGHIILTQEEDVKTILIVNNDIPILEYDDSQHMDDVDRNRLHCEMEYEDGDKIPLSEPSGHIGVRGFQEMLEPNTCSQENVSVDLPVNIEHIDDHDCEINYQDQVDETFDVANDHVPCPKVDEEKESEQVVMKEADFGSKDAEDIVSNDLEHEERKPIELEYEKPKPKRPGIKETDEEEPKKEELSSKVVSENQQVVAYRKKDTATRNRVIDESLSTLREQRRNRVKALVGAFETVMSH